MKAQTLSKLKKRTVFVYKSIKRTNSLNNFNPSTGDPTTSVTTTSTVTDPTTSGF